MYQDSPHLNIIKDGLNIGVLQCEEALQPDILIPATSVYKWTPLKNRDQLWCHVKYEGNVQDCMDRAQTVGLVHQFEELREKCRLCVNE